MFGAGGILLWWNQTAIEHYHAGLEEGRTHLTVDFATAPEAVEALIGWILQRDPKSRPPYGAALVAEVKAALQRALALAESSEKHSRYSSLL